MSATDSATSLSSAPVTPSGTSQSEYRKAYCEEQTVKTKVFVEPSVGWKKRNESSIMRSPEKENRKPSRSWPWKERAQISNIFDSPTKKLRGICPKRTEGLILPPLPEPKEPKVSKVWPWQKRAKEITELFGPHIETPRKTRKRWPWQIRASSSCIFEFEEPVKLFRKMSIDGKPAALVTNSPKKQWPWQIRANSSEIFKEPPALISKFREYSWHQRKTTHVHNVDSEAKLDGLTQYKKDFVCPLSRPQSKDDIYDGPSYGYRFLLNRRKSLASKISEDELIIATA